MSFSIQPRVNDELVEPRVFFGDIPLFAIRQKTREKLSQLLNPEKVLRSENGYCRDWRGIFTLSNLSLSDYRQVESCRDKTSKLLDLWSKSQKDANVSRLQDCFALIDRFDIYDDTFDLLIEDSQAFLSKNHSESNSKMSGFEIVKADFENDIILLQDMEAYDKGLPLKVFDAFVIYDEKDVEFATELIEKCENMGHSLCVKERDFLGGFSFEGDAILGLLAKRCHRLIIIVSKAFLRSPMQIFITNYAQALGIERNYCKIVPVLLEPCELPQMLRYCFRFDYYKNSKIFDFWDRLDKTLSIKIPQQVNDRPTPSNSLKDSISTAQLTLHEKKDNNLPEPVTPSPRSKRSSRTYSSNLNLASENPVPIPNKLSQSSFYLNKIDSQDVELKTKSKGRKWYKIFHLPNQSQSSREKELDEQIHKRPWYKTKTKKTKQKAETS